MNKINALILKNALVALAFSVGFFGFVMGVDELPDKGDNRQGSHFYTVFPLEELKVPKGALHVASYNCYLSCYDQDNHHAWRERLPHVAGMMKSFKPHAIGLQELNYPMYMDLVREVPRMNFVGFNCVNGQEFHRYKRQWVDGQADDTDENHEFVAISYDPHRFSLLSVGRKWLSATPENPSRGWDGSQYPRLLMWLELKDRKTGQSNFVFNSHYDHDGQVARLEAGKLERETIAQVVGESPYFSLADRNYHNDGRPEDHQDFVNWHKDGKTNDFFGVGVKADYDPVSVWSHYGAMDTFIGWENHPRRNDFKEDARPLYYDVGYTNQTPLFSYNHLGQYKVEDSSRPTLAVRPFVPEVNGKRYFASDHSWVGAVFQGLGGSLGQ